MNLALRFAALLHLFLYTVLAFFVVIASVTDAAGVAVGFFYGLNVLFNAAAVSPCLIGFLPKKLLLIFFFCSSTNCAASKNSMRLMCLEAINGVEMENFNVNLNFFIRWSSGVLAYCHSLNI